MTIQSNPWDNLEIIQDDGQIVYFRTKEGDITHSHRHSPWKGDRVPGNYWTLERCIEAAKAYKTRSDWRKASNPSFQAASRNGWVEQCSKHMIRLIAQLGYWTRPRILEDAQRYKTIGEWKLNSGGAYMAARRFGCLNESTGHMVSPKKPNGYWTLAKCRADALKYAKQGDWVKSNSSAYTRALKSGWLEACVAHMKPKTK